MSLSDAVYRAISNRSPLTEGGPVRGIVHELARAHGTHPPAGIAERTWRRARHEEGWKPTARVRDALEAAQRRARLSAGRERWLRSPADIGISASIRVSSDVRDRRILVTRWRSWQQRYAGIMVDRFLARDDASMGDPILWALTQEVPELTIGDESGIVVRFFHTSGDADRWLRDG